MKQPFVPEEDGTCSSAPAAPTGTLVIHKVFYRAECCCTWRILQQPIEEEEEEEEGTHTHTHTRLPLSQGLRSLFEDLLG